MADHPFYEVAKEAEALVAAGNTVHQKFTCEKCGSRQTMEEPNVFYHTGACQECGHVTNIVLKGCNYLLIRSLK